VVNDVNTRFAMLESDIPDHIAFMQQKNRIELFPSVEDPRRQFSGAAGVFLLVFGAIKGR
jgi:hypothetical protein